MTEVKFLGQTASPLLGLLFEIVFSDRAPYPFTILPSVVRNGSHVAELAQTASIELPPQEELSLPIPPVSICGESEMQFIFRIEGTPPPIYTLHIFIYETGRPETGVHSRGISVYSSFGMARCVRICSPI